MFAKLSSSFQSFSQQKRRLSGSNASSQSGYCAGGQGAPLPEAADQLATYLVPGSAVVQVAGSGMPTPLSKLQPGEKILGLDIAGGYCLVWSTVQHIQAVPATAMEANHTIMLGLGKDDVQVPLKAEQVVLAKDRKKKAVMQPVRRLEIGMDSVIVYDADKLQWKGKNAQEAKKINTLRLSRDRDTADEGLYKVILGRPDHSLLMSSDATHFVVVNAINSTLDMKAIAKCDKVAQRAEPAMEIKNTFLEYKDETDDGAGVRGIPRSYSDSDIQKLAFELDLNEDRNVGMPVFSKDDMLDLSSNHSSTLSHLTSKSRASSFLAKSEVSSISGGSVHQVRLGTQPCLDEEGNQVSKATTEFRLSEYNELPVNEFGVRLSAASSQHQPGKRSRCRKCAFYNTFSIKRGKVCKNGALCDFCHDSHDRFIHRR